MRQSLEKSRFNPPTFPAQGRSRPSGWRRWRRLLQYYYRRFLTLNDTPEAIARGLACGVFTGLFPVFGLQIVFGIALATVFRGNKIAAALGTWISNPLTSIPIFFCNFQVGAWLLGEGIKTLSFEDLKDFETLLQLKEEILVALLLGSAVMGLICSICSYFIGLESIRRFRRWNPRKKLKNHRYR